MDSIQDLIYEIESMYSLNTQQNGSQVPSKTGFMVLKNDDDEYSSNIDSNNQISNIISGSRELLRIAEHATFNDPKIFIEEKSKLYSKYSEDISKANSDLIKEFRGILRETLNKLRDLDRKHKKFCKCDNSVCEENICRNCCCLKLEKEQIKIEDLKSKESHSVCIICTKNKPNLKQISGIKRICYDCIIEYAARNINFRISTENMKMTENVEIPHLGLITLQELWNCCPNKEFFQNLCRIMTFFTHPGIFLKFHS